MATKGGTPKGPEYDGKLVMCFYQLKNVVKLEAGTFVVVRTLEVGNIEQIAKVEAVVRDKTQKVQVFVTWLYRPESTLGGHGRLPYHGKDELFLSNHEDCLDVETIERKCKVLTLLQYLELKKVGPEHDTYFARYFYEAKLQNVTPISGQSLQIYCLCKLPCNPDKMMIACDQCQEWFHLDCVGLSEVDLKRINRYFCQNCKCSLNKGVGTSS